jgi:hypothetical protein
MASDVAAIFLNPAAHFDHAKVADLLMSRDKVCCEKLANVGV